jgi:hypothetical protein
MNALLCVGGVVLLLVIGFFYALSRLVRGLHL